jgi:hypothetical protein
MPELWLLGFRGATRASYRAFAEADPLLYTGHVGLSLDRGATIFGFSPLAPDAPPREVIDRLKRGDTFPGIVRDDRPVFVRAAEAAVRGLLASPVYLWAQPADRPTLARLRALIQDDMLAGVSAAKAYGWLGGRAGVYNCATWPRSLGVAVPEETGQLADYIAALRRVSGGRRWTP